MHTHDVYILRAACNFRIKFLLSQIFLREILAVPIGHGKYPHMLKLPFSYVHAHFPALFYF